MFFKIPVFFFFVKNNLIIKKFILHISQSRHIMNFTKLILWRKQKTWNIEIKADRKSSLTKQNINKREIRRNFNNWYITNLRVKTSLKFSSYQFDSSRKDYTKVYKRMNSEPLSDDYRPPLVRASGTHSPGSGCPATWWPRARLAPSSRDSPSRQQCLVWCHPKSSLPKCLH